MCDKNQSMHELTSLNLLDPTRDVTGAPAETRQKTPLPVLWSMMLSITNLELIFLESLQNSTSILADVSPTFVPS